jgi:von Willebrand factor type A domain
MFMLLITSLAAGLALSAGLFFESPANAVTARLALGGTTVAAAGSRADSPSTPQPVDVVILADESGSMLTYKNEITGMQQAATQIVNSEWSPESRIAIYGFASAPPGGRLSSAAIDQYCGLTALSSPGARTTLDQCAADIKGRTTAAEGWNTDFAAALQQAYQTLAASRAAGRLPLVFFMTDGMLDEGPSSPYVPKGVSDPQGQAGDQAAQALITEPNGLLAQLKNAGAEIWPVGFGQADKAELSLFAGGGAQSGCPAGSGVNPQPTIVPPTVGGAQETQDIQSALIKAFAEARCAVLVAPPPAPLCTGCSVHKTVTVSELATTATFIVDKGAPGVIVTYQDPAGRKFSDTSSAGQGASAVGGVLTGGRQSGQADQSVLETLLVDNPTPGPWTVTFTDPPGVPATEVGLSLIWQGAVSLEFTDQQVGDPGQQYTLAVQPVVRSARVPASALTGFTGQFTVTWPGGHSVTEPARLDTSTGTVTSGDFTARVPVPLGLNGTATAVFTGAAPGVQGQEDTSFPVRPGGGLTVTLNNTSGERVSPGGTLQIPGTIDTHGQPGTSIVFALSGLSNGVDASLTSPFGAMRVPSGRVPVTLKIHFDGKARLGKATGTIQWAPSGQDSAPSDWLSPASLDVIIAYPPLPPWSKWWFWLIIGIAAAVILAVLGWRIWTWWIGKISDPGDGDSADSWGQLATDGPGHENWDIQ